MAEDLQWGLSSARVDVRGRSPVVVHEVGNTVYSEPHLPALRERLVIQQTEKTRSTFSDGPFHKKLK